MRPPTTIEIEILRRCFNVPSGEFALYDLHRDNLLSPGQLSNACRPLEEAGILAIMDAGENGPVAHLTPEGREWVVRYRKQLFLRNETRPWARPPRSSIGPSIAMNEPYLPNLKKVKKRFFLSGIEASPKRN